MKFKKGDSIVLTKDLFAYNAGEYGIIEKAVDGEYWVKLDNSGWFRWTPEFLDELLELESVYNSPLYKALL